MHTHSLTFHRKVCKSRACVNSVYLALSWEGAGFEAKLPPYSGWFEKSHKVLIRVEPHCKGWNEILAGGLISSTKRAQSKCPY